MDEVMANKDILDATQDAVLNAASSVADVLENTAEEFGGAAEPFYMEAEFWVGAAFVLVVLALARPVGKAVLGLLRARGEGIAKRIAEAVNLKEEAQRLKAEYERKFRGAEKEAAETLKRSEREIEALKKDTLARLEADMQKREQEVKMHLEMAQAAAVDAVAASAADLTMAAVRKILTDKLDDADYDRMIDEAINEI